MYNRQQILDRLSIEGYYIDSFILRGLISSAGIEPSFEDENNVPFYSEGALEELKSLIDAKKTSNEFIVDIFDKPIQKTLVEVEKPSTEEVSEKTAKIVEQEKTVEKPHEQNKYDNMLPEEAANEEQNEAEISNQQSETELVNNETESLDDFSEELPVSTRAEKAPSTLQDEIESLKEAYEKEIEAQNSEILRLEDTNKRLESTIEKLVTKIKRLETLVSELNKEKMELESKKPHVPTQKKEPVTLQKPPAEKPIQKTSQQPEPQGFFAEMFGQKKVLHVANLYSQLKKSINDQSFAILQKIGEIASENNYNVYLIGGVIRDAMLSEPVKDIDVLVEGNALGFCKILEKELGARALQVQQELRCAKILIDGCEFDFASTREEYYPRPGQMPVIKSVGCTLNKDVTRRDFTINTMAASLNKENQFDLIDLLKGKADLDNGIIRVLHKNSFTEDPTRIIRALKYSAKCGFKPEEKTKRLEEKYLFGKINTNLCYERIKSELRKTFNMNSHKAFDMYLNEGIYKLVNDGAETGISGIEIKNAIDSYAKNAEETWLIYLGSSLSCFSSWKMTEIADKLLLSNSQKSILTNAASMIQSPNVGLDDNFEIHRYFKNKEIEAIIIYYLKTKDKNALHFIENLKEIKIEINGEDLINLGLSPSPKFSEIFFETLKAKLNGHIHTKEEEIDFVKKICNIF